MVWTWRCLPLIYCLALCLTLLAREVVSQADPEQAEADAFCVDDNGPGWIAVKDPATDDWGQCVPKPDPNKKTCFVGRYVDAKTGEKGCCGKGKSYSFGPISKEGACCEKDSTFKEFDVPPKQGDCCPKGNTWTAGCKDMGSFKYPINDCPVINRNVRITPSGPQYDLFCGIQTERADLKPAEPAQSFLACVDACGATPGCYGVDFFKPDKLCYFKSEYMTPSTGGAGNDDVDSASMECEELGDAEPCPSLDGKVRCIDSDPFRFFCGKAVWGENLVATTAPTLNDCMKQCAANTKCQGADWNHQDKSTCGLKSEYKSGPLEGPGYHGMVPLKPRVEY
ncbi:MAG: hypothetical protein M1833_001910 [Piccolia ochrophora]|nr:MAG: hypothetical protein M1833_001910 [Piccolia ochrophora]